MVVGVLALQGDFEEHIQSLSRYHVESLEVRSKADLKRVDVLIIPGGESTVIAKLLLSTGLDKEIVKRSKEGMFIWGTCAGAILLAKKVISSVELELSLNLLNIEIERNGYGRQLDSFAAEFNFEGKKVKGLFIRAPRIVKVGRAVKILASYKGEAVFLSSKNIFASTFHSELYYPDYILEFLLKKVIK